MLQAAVLSPVSYNQFLELMAGSLVPLGHCLLWLSSLSTKTGVQFIDSTSLVVCAIYALTGITYSKAVRPEAAPLRVGSSGLSCTSWSMTVVNCLPCA